MSSAELTPAVPDPVAVRHFVTPGYRWGFVLVVSLFFLWALANNFNDILIRQFQKALGLNRGEAGFIQFVFYIGYFVVALPAGLLMRRFGYRAGVLTGLGLYAVGALLFLPASLMTSYALFLVALFLIAAGAACLETTGNAYVGVFGDPASAVRRLNLAQAFNGLGGFFAPIIGGTLIFSGVEHSKAVLAQMSPAALQAYRASEVATVRLPYALLAIAVLLVAAAVGWARLPEGRSEDTAHGDLRTLIRRPALRGAVIAQFFYVGAQVGVWSFFIDFAKEAAPDLSERNAAFLLSISLLLFMIGRFTGTALMTRVRPTTLLGSYALANVGLCAVAAMAGGRLALGALMLVSFFMSIMFPTIFGLGVEGLGAAKPLGSSCIVMAIVGGAIFPPLMGVASVWTGSVAIIMLLPLACFVVIAAYARRAHRAWPQASDGVPG
ncbi:L-fucose:H+ symporter permease [Sphingomonas sp. OK281]|uniref:L-fucose:H+ symporter permease n=1 Tax=Sphingomonas sp. OK281 TaxID=1881067 RepID=UPI0008EF4FFE|nr:L-fucose:H+ symporter permease [Sphingomonas sp. OK281]SFO19468.1 MFS transporter, FHS family, L-fucose permease [Sphingomonas sp. OK281]